MSESKNKNISVHYGPQETGWAEPLGNGTFRICNIPFQGDFNVDDIVTLRVDNSCECTRPVVDIVISSVYPHRRVVTYQPSTKKNYKSLWHAVVDDLGGKCEGFVKGHAGVAVKDEEELVAKLKTLHFKAELVEAAG